MPLKVGYKAPMDTNQPQIKTVEENKLDSIIEGLGITDISPEVLKSATLTDFVLDEIKSALDESEKPIH